MDTEAVEGMQPTPRGFVVHRNASRPANWPSAVIESASFQFMAHDELNQRFTEMVKTGRKQEVISALNLVQPRITGIELLTDETGDSYFSAETDNGQLPLFDLGGGIIRIFKLLLGIFTAQDGIHLVDEFENGFHYSVLEEIWRLAREWMREWNVQFFATTHSAECIDAAIEAFENAPEDLSIHNLFRNSETGNIEAATFSGETLEGARDLHLEMR